MKMIMELTEKLNPSQATIITADQPVYTLGKQVQWMFPEMYQNLIWMMGPLHIEMAYMSAIDDWLEGSGRIEVFERAKITTSGR